MSASASLFSFVRSRLQTITFTSYNTNIRKNEGRLWKEWNIIFNFESRKWMFGYILFGNSSRSRKKPFWTMNNIFHYISLTTITQKKYAFTENCGFQKKTNYYSQHWHIPSWLNRCHVFTRKINNNISQSTEKLSSFPLNADFHGIIQ